MQHEIEIERDYEPDEDAVRSAVTILMREPIAHEGKLPKAEEKDTAA